MVLGTTRMWGSEDDLYVVGNQGTIAQNTGTGMRKDAKWHES